MFISRWRGPSGGGGTGGGRRGSYILKKEVSRTGEWELVREKVQVDLREGQGGLKVLGEGGGITWGWVELKGVGEGGCWRIGFWSPAYLFRQEPPQCCLVYFWLLGLSVLSKISRMWSWVKPLLWIIQGFMLCKKPNRKYLVVSLPNSLYNPLKHIT